jgi:hypothetical protein
MNEAKRRFLSEWAKDIRHFSDGFYPLGSTTLLVATMGFQCWNLEQFLSIRVKFIELRHIFGSILLITWHVIFSFCGLIFSLSD